MPEYRAYTIGPDGHILRVDLICVDEETARQRAKQPVDGHGVQPWLGDKRIATFRHLDS